MGCLHTSDTLENKQNMKIIKKIYQNTWARVLCFYRGHWGVVDMLKRQGTCSRCERKFKIEQSMRGNKIIWKKQIK